MRMTDAGIRNLKPKANRYDVWEDGRTGFGVRVAPSGRKTFQFMYWKDGKARRLTIGIYGDIGLAQARVKYAEAKKALEENRDPAAETVAQRQVERDAETVNELAGAYLTKWARPRKRSAAEDERILRKDVLPLIGRTKVHDVRRRDIIELVDRVVSRGSPIAANRTLACVRRMFNWAAERDIIDASPAVRVKAPSKENKRTRTLSDAELKVFWHGLARAEMSEGTRLALKFALATAQRRGEVAAAEWPEFDREKSLWTIPAEKAKNNEQHVVPLSRLAMRLLDDIEANSGDARFLFPSRVNDAPITAAALSHALRNNLDKIGVKGVRVHDLRRSAATQMAALGIDRMALSRVLNHFDGSTTGRYDTHHYLEQKAIALKRWGQSIEDIIAGKKVGATVVELATHRQ